MSTQHLLPSDYAWLTCCLLLAPLLMGHHPSFPAPLQFVPMDADVDSSVDDEDWVLVATMGFISSERSHELACKEAFGVDGVLYAGVLGPSHYAMAAGQEVAITFDSCNLDESHPVDGWIVDVAASPPDRLAVLTNRPQGDHVYISTDGGQSLQDPVAIDADLRSTSIEWLDDQQVAASAFDDQSGDAHLVVIDNASQSTSIREFDSQLRYPFLLAADGDSIVSAARRPDFGSTPALTWGSTGDPDRHDADLETWPIGGDINTDAVWAAPVQDDWDDDWTGVAVGDDEGHLEFDERLEDHDTRCVVDDADGLWICSNGFAEAYEIWRVDNGEDPEPFYRLAYLDGPRTDCPDDSDVAQTCPDQWELIEGDIPQRPLDADDDYDEQPPDDNGNDGPDRLPDWHDDVIGNGSDGADDDQPSEDDANPDDAACAQVTTPSTLAIYLAAIVLVAAAARFVTTRRRDRKATDRR